MQIGYLGPEGTFSQMAAMCLGGEKGRLRAFQTIGDCVAAVECGLVAAGVVPVENSTEGVINTTVDCLIFDAHVYIQEQIAIKIDHQLMAKTKSTAKDIKKIFSHSQTLAQCRKFLNDNFRGIPQVAVSSNAEAARHVAGSQEPAAAIAPAFAAEIYGLAVLMENIQDSAQNQTRFALISKGDTSAPAPGCKTTLAFGTPNRPGALYKVLEIFSLWDINLTSIISRPMRGTPGEYVFVVDAECPGNVEDLRDGLKMIRRKTYFYKVLGTYKTSAPSLVPADGV
ncbi:MAG: prephenate dehydratase [Clostridiales bacterium]|jgi:prephenate dehydratase|nr:prephenate dehydratase [Clostridiales bacterium]